MMTPHHFVVTNLWRWTRYTNGDPLDLRIAHDTPPPGGTPPGTHDASLSNPAHMLRISFHKRTSTIHSLRHIYMIRLTCHIIDTLLVTIQAIVSTVAERSYPASLAFTSRWRTGTTTILLQQTTSLSNALTSRGIEWYIYTYTFTDLGMFPSATYLAYIAYVISTHITDKRPTYNPTQTSCLEPQYRNCQNR
jgi:hypothetical protein